MPEVNDFNIIKKNGEQTYIRAAPTYVDSHYLLEGVPELITVPDNALYVLFSSVSDFYAKANSLPELPDDYTSDGSAGELNPTAWALSSDSFSVTGIGVVSEADSSITFSFYK